MPTPPRPSSPSQLSPSLIRELKQAHGTLVSSKDTLSKLDIPKLKEALLKLCKLLQFFGKGKGNEEVVAQLVSHAERLQITLDPIVEAAKRSPSFSISEGLTRGLRDLFKALDSAIPEKIQPSRFNLFSGSVDASSVVHGANSKIEAALNSFLQGGNIKQTGGHHLFQGIPPSETRSPTQNTKAVPTSPQSRYSQGTSELQAASSSRITGQPGDLPPQIQNSLTKCPRFRILLLGKSGAGKSSLINKVFGVSSALVANHKAGHAEIAQEHTSDTNPYFVLHDSMGFESGSQEKYTIVENFIQERSKKTELSEKLHAIWLCAAIPVSGGRVFESGDERIFKLNLGNVPIIVVFTKYDKLVAKIEINAEDMDSAQLQAKVSHDFEKLCTQPLQQIRGNDPNQKTPPSVKVSVEKDFGYTLIDLIRLTRDLLPPNARDQLPADLGSHLVSNAGEVTLESSGQPAPESDEPGYQDHPFSNVAMSFAVAQRFDVGMKIEAIIAIGRQRYWQSLASTFDFSGKTLDRCITVVHYDIVQVWNFHDPHMCLSSEKFEAMMSQIHRDLFDTGKTTFTADFAANNPAVTDTTGMLGAMLPPSILISGPLDMTAAFVKWVREVYQRTPGVIRCLMAYIVDLTIIMRRVFWHMQAKGGIYPVPQDIVEQASKEYSESMDRADVHRAIREFVDKMGAFQRTRKDAVVGEIERLILHHRFEPS